MCLPDERASTFVDRHEQDCRLRQKNDTLLAPDSTI
jgi:hypothetical protein